MTTAAIASCELWHFSTVAEPVSVPEPLPDGDDDCALAVAVEDFLLVVSDGRWEREAVVSAGADVALVGLSSEWLSPAATGVRDELPDGGPEPPEDNAEIVTATNTIRMTSEPAASNRRRQ